MSSRSSHRISSSRTSLSFGLRDSDVDTEEERKNENETKGGALHLAKQLRKEKRKAVKNLKNVREILSGRKDDDPCFAAVYRWILFGIGFLRYPLFLGGFIAGAIEDRQSVTWLAILTDDIFEVSAFCSLTFLFSDMREGSKRLQILVAASIPLGLVLDVLYTSVNLPSGFNMTRFIFKLCVFIIMSSIVAYRMYLASYNIIADVKKEVLKSVMSQIVFRSILSYLLPMAYVITEVRASPCRNATSYNFDAIFDTVHTTSLAPSLFRFSRCST